MNGMRMNLFQKLALAALVSLILLMFVGAIVRASGAGMGCPDWPKCWGKLIPPTEAGQINVDELDLNKHERKWKRYRPDEPFPGKEIISEFNAVHTWTEFINRLVSLPLGFATLAMFVLSLWYVKKRPVLFVGSAASLFLVLINAWMGMKIVATGLKPGVITTHMALAMLLLCILVYLVWGGGEERKQFVFKYKSHIMPVAWVLFLLLIGEGILGSQVRELTDELKKTHPSAARSEWSDELESSWMYVVHRSFSWVILLLGGYFTYLAWKLRSRKLGWSEYTVMGIILAQMVLGLLLSKVGILPIVQVLHIGLSSILLTAMFYWLLCGARSTVLATRA